MLGVKICYQKTIGKFFGILNLVFTVPQIAGSNIGAWIADNPNMGVEYVFWIAIGFFLLSIPCFLWVKETMPKTCDRNLIFFLTLYFLKHFILEEITDGFMFLFSIYVSGLMISPVFTLTVAFFFLKYSFINKKVPMLKVKSTRSENSDY